MNTTQNETVKRHARDLRRQDPRPPDHDLGGFEGGARVVDKCRAALLGWEGEFHFGCPFDQSFARNTGIDLNDLRDLVATGASDDEIADWLRNHAHPQTAG